MVVRRHSHGQGQGGRLLPRLPLFWQWCLLFVTTVAIVRHYRLTEHQSSEVDDGGLPGHAAAAAASGGEAAARTGLVGLTARPPPPPEVQQRGCPMTNPVPWGTLPHDPAKNRAAVFTPYNIVFGGGERYLLTVVQVMQEMGHAVDVLVRENNVCATKEQLLKVATGLRVPLNPDLLSLEVVTVKGIHIFPPREGYSMFMLLGNDKLPTFAGLGHVNFYMCQFPFDLNRPPRPGTTKAYATYDYVLLNSGYTDRWYNIAARTHIETAMRLYGSAPTVVVLYPPVEPFPAKSQLHGGEGGEGEAAEAARHHIMVLGRFFSGRQSKGHGSAIDIFEGILPALPPGTQLNLVGNLMPGHSAYVAGLRKRAKHLPVNFHIGVSPQVIEEVMHTSLVQWHLTGIELEVAEDPASEEHFGISIAEGMSAGVIPVVLNRGGVTDIVRHGVTGYLGSNAAQLANITKEVFALDQASLGQLRTNAVTWVEKFSTKSFSKTFRMLANRGRLTKPFRHLVQQTRDIVTPRAFTLPKSSPKAAIIIEARQHYAFEYVVKNTMFHLGEEWSLFVYHGKSNSRFVKDALASVANTNFRELDTDQLPVATLNALLKAPEFWGELRGAGADRVLFFQTDSLLVHGGIQPFLQYDYVGAPWHRKNERWGPKQAAMPQGVGNGGLSLRSVPTMEALARAYGNTSGTQQEDFLWASIMERLPGQYKLAPREEALRFCIEVPCEEFETPQKGHKKGGKDAGGGADQALAAAGVDAAASGASGGGTAPLQTLPFTPMAVHATWYYMWGTAQRFADLLTMLETSVCGPVPGGAAGAALLGGGDAAAGVAAAVAH